MNAKEFITFARGFTCKTMNPPGYATVTLLHPLILSFTYVGEKAHGHKLIHKRVAIGN